jgi:hypothetical protein
VERQREDSPGACSAAPTGEALGGIGREKTNRKRKRERKSKKRERKKRARKNKKKEKKKKHQKSKKIKNSYQTPW